MKNLVIIILLFISTNCFTQDKYINGFIITLNGDTIYGLIDVDKPFNNNRICNFKKDLSSESSIYGPNEISAYRYLDGKYFIARDLDLDSVTIKRVFLQWIIKGKINIYSYIKDGVNITYFAESETETLTELKDTERQYINEYNDTYSISKHEYIGTLNYFTRAYDEMAPIISNSKLNDRSLIKVVKIYTEEFCNDDKCIVYEKPAKKISITVSFIIGANRVHNDLSEYSLFEHNEYSELSDLQRGVNFCFSDFDYLARNFSFETGLYYNNYFLKVDSKIYEEVSFSSLQIPISVAYSFFVKDLEPYIFAGMQFFTKANSNINNMYLSSLSSLSWGANFGLGLKYIILKHYVVQVNGSYSYNHRYIFSNQQSFGNLLSMQLMFGYRF
jgi:hypothetical protein